ncbi:MAG: O-antigen ligase family protein [Alphaproteobacteria bacterium]|nr:O-antigen ligase family protein [Alphaproteobacteria bacterium]
MNTLSAAHEDTKLAPWFLIGSMALMILFSLEFPRILGWFPFLIGIGTLIYCRFWIQEKLIIPKTLGLTLLGIIILASTSLIWSEFSSELPVRILKIAGLFIGGLVLYTSLPNIKIGNHPALLLLPLAAGATMFLCSLELIFDLQLYHLSHGTTRNPNISTAVLNRGIVFQVLLFFPMLTIIKKSALEENHKKQATVFYCALMLIMLALTQSQSAQLAFVIGTLTYFVFPYKYKPAYKITAILIAIAIVTTPFIVKLMFNAIVVDVNSVPWIKEGYAAERLEIWNFVTSYALKSPVFGHGILVTRFIEDFDTKQIFFKAATVLHPHNFSVQIWIEFGAIGALLASALFAFYLNTISKEKPEDSRLTLAVFISALTVMAVGYGMWQSWWIGMLFFIASLIALIKRLPSNSTP